MKPPLQIGDTVITSFYKNEKHVLREVVGVYRQDYCQSGWFVQTTDPNGKMLCCDSGWFVRFNPDDEHVV